MFMINVQCHVKSEFIQEFITATLDNAFYSNQEPGVARFEVYQQKDDPTQFSLMEIYRSDDARNQHRESAHYNRWREKVEDMLVEARTRTTYDILFPPPAEW